MDRLATTAHLERRSSPVRAYVTGLCLAVLLTLAPFTMVMSGGTGRAAAFWTIVVCGAVQMLVHLVFFLHLNSSAGQRWYRVALAFTVLIIAILVSGSVWIMNHLNHNMMVMPSVLN